MSLLTEVAVVDRAKPAWRHTLALAHASMGRRPVDEDSWINAQYLFLRALETGRRPNKAGEVPFAVMEAAHRLYDDPSLKKEYVNALLLCAELSLGDVAKHFDLSVDDITAYERLYFAVRDENGHMSEKVWVVAGCANIIECNNDTGTKESDINLPTYWRSYAFQHGYQSLMTLWGWDRFLDIQISQSSAAMSLFRELYRNLHSRLVRGMLSSTQLTMLCGTLASQISALKEAERGGGSADKKLEDLVLALAGSAKITLKDITEDRKVSKEAAMRAKIEARESLLSKAGDNNQ